MGHGTEVELGMGTLTAREAGMGTGTETETGVDVDMTEVLVVWCLLVGSILKQLQSTRPRDSRVRDERSVNIQQVEDLWQGGFRRCGDHFLGVGLARCLYLLCRWAYH